MIRPHIRWLALSAMAVALPAATRAGPDGRIRGLEQPVAQLRWNLDHDKRGQPGQVATRTCLVFAHWAVLSSDEGEMGVDDLEFRARPPSLSPRGACRSDFQGRSVRAALEEALDPLGVFDHWLVAEAPDSFGILGSFWLYDLMTGTRAYGDEYEDDRGLRLERAVGGVQLDYWAGLEGAACVPRRGESACWTRTLERLHLPARLPAPDCTAVLRAYPELKTSPDGTQTGQFAQIAIHVRVRGFQRGEATVLLERPSCAPTP